MSDNPTILPDGSAFFTASWPLPKDHWLYAERVYMPGHEDPVELPSPITTHADRDRVTAAVRYAIRAATMNGKEPDFDPDALVQNAVYALCGPFGKAARATPKQGEALSEAVIDDLLSRLEVLCSLKGQSWGAAKNELLRITRAAETPEGCTPADARMLRTANHALAQESHELQEALADLYGQVKRFCAERGEADFETGRALHLLSRVRPLEFNWPFAEPPEAAPSPQQVEPGWVRVPVEPTREMIMAARTTLGSSMRDGGPYEDWRIFIRAAIAAAPKEPKP